VVMKSRPLAEPPKSAAPNFSSHLPLRKVAS
jgi:hypothetical protein